MALGIRRADLLLYLSLSLNSYKNLKVSHPRCVVKIQVREENPIFVQSQNTTKHKTKFFTTLQQHVSA